MSQDDSATNRKLVEDCRAHLERDLCELIEDLGPRLVEEARAQAAATRDEARRGASISLQLNAPERLKKLVPALRTAMSQRAEQAARPGQEHTALDSLHILSDDETAAQLVMRDIIDRVSAECSEETNALERRIAHLVLRNALPRGDTTFRVASLFASIDAAAAQAWPEADQRRLALELIGRHLADELPQLYRAINELFIDADILPRLKRGYSDAPAVDPGAAAAESARLMSTIEKLAKARSTAAGGAPAAAPAASRKEFIASLQKLQTLPTTTAPGTHTNVVRLARDSDAARHVDAAESVTLDIVAELFDLIFGDEHVSEGIKQLVGRLQTPVLKVAMQNQQFFADHGHPARRFLDSISAIAIRWGKTVNADDPFYRKLSELVERIQQTYDGDLAVFDRANAELAEFLAERERIEAEASRLLAEAVRAREEEMRVQREAQLRAQKAADAAIVPLLTAEVPPAIEQFLLNYWRDVLQGRIFSSGADSAPAADALKIAGDLLWIVEPKHNAADRQRQVSTLPALLKQLTAGFDEIGASSTERTAFMDSLVELALSALRADKRAPKKPAEGAKPAPRRSAPTLQVSHATATGVKVQDISLPDAQAASEDATPDRTHLRQVRQLVRGDWVDFITAGQTRRERLTWVNPSRSLFLFSNSVSECAISITPEALAVRLKNDTARLVKRDAPIFERALRGAVQSLDRLVR